MEMVWIVGSLVSGVLVGWIVYRIVQSRGQKSNMSQVGGERAPPQRRDCVAYYINMRPRPAAFIATGVPTDSGMVDVMFFTGTEMAASRLDRNIRQLLASAKDLLPVMPDDASHRAACRAELDRYFGELFKRLAETGHSDMTSEDQQVLSFFQLVLGEHEPNAITDALKRTKGYQKGGTVAVTRFLQEKRRTALPDRPIRKHTQSIVRVRRPR